MKLYICLGIIFIMALSGFLYAKNSMEPKTMLKSLTIDYEQEEINGEIINISNKTIEKAELDLVMYSEENTVIATQSIDTTDFKSGQTWYFTFYMFEQEFQSYKIFVEVGK